MHHVLLISELVREIVASLDQSSLAAVARTCCALQEPALNELWRDLYTIYPYLHLFNQVTWKSTEQQWATLCKYSTRTRTLYMYPMEDSPSELSELFPSLSNVPDPVTFFPNIRAVAWYPANHIEMLPFLRLICGPSLTCLSAEFATDPFSIAMLGSLGTLCPNITDISVCSPRGTSDKWINALSTSICLWNNLNYVSCDDLTVNVMEHLSQVRGLESLTACPSGRALSLSQVANVYESSFARLQHLHLYAGQLSAAISCFMGLHLVLREFRLDLFEEILSDPSWLRTLFSTLSEACSRRTLTRFELCVHKEFPSDSFATIRDMRPLLSFNDLRVVCFEGVPRLSFSDDDIAELASAWPHVEELALATYINHPLASLPTLQSLVHLVRSCPRLRALSLVVDATKVSVPSFNASGNELPRSDILDDLCLGNSPVISPVAVANILCSLYPALKHVGLSVWNKEPLNHLPRRDQYKELWGLVNVELRALRAGRQGRILFTE